MMKFMARDEASILFSVEVTRYQVVSAVEVTRYDVVSH